MASYYINQYDGISRCICCDECVCVCDEICIYCDEFYSDCYCHEYCELCNKQLAACKCNDQPEEVSIENIIKKRNEAIKMRNAREQREREEDKAFRLCNIKGCM